MGCFGPLTHKAGSATHPTGTAPPPSGSTFSSLVSPETLHLYMLLYCRQLHFQGRTQTPPQRPTTPRGVYTQHTISSPYPSPCPAWWIQFHVHRHPPAGHFGSPQGIRYSVSRVHTPVWFTEMTIKSCGCKALTSDVYAMASAVPPRYCKSGGEPNRFLVCSGPSIWAQHERLTGPDSASGRRDGDGDRHRNGRLTLHA